MENVFNFFMLSEIINEDINNILDQIKSKFRIVYLDPPYYTQCDFGEFDDHWDSLDAYLYFMKKIMLKIPNVLEEDGVFVLHCDYHASHYLKTLGDIIFGYDNFANEIFTKRSAKNAGNATRSLFINLDSLLIWYKSEKGRIETVPTRPLDKGERWSTLSAGGPGGPKLFFGEAIYPPSGRHFMWGQERIDKEIESGNIRLNSNGTPMYRVTSDMQFLGTLWDDIPSYEVNGSYPTQKSLRLLQRIITTYSQPGDWIGDFMCGSGTTAVAAKSLGRNYICSDLNPNAYDMACERVLSPSNIDDLYME